VRKKAAEWAVHLAQFSAGDNSQLQRLTRFFTDFGLRGASSQFQRHRHARG
jgi:hypothetical protein